MGDLVKDKSGHVGIVLDVYGPTLIFPYQTLRVSFINPITGLCRPPEEGILSTDVEVVSEMS